MNRVLLIILALAVAAAAVAFCSDSRSIAGGDGSVATIEVAPPNATVMPNGIVTFQATARGPSGEPVPGASVQWSSDATGVATINGDGIARGVAPGSARITATAGGVSGTSTLVVTAPVSGPTVLVDPATRYQVMTGWEAVAQAGHEEPNFNTWKNVVFDRAVNELGINRLRLPVRSGAETNRDFWIEYRNKSLTEQAWRCARYATVNDNADPNVESAAGFRFSEMDFIVENVVLPMKQRLRAIGEDLYVNLNYTAFTGQICSGYSYHHLNAQEYAEFVLAAFRHLDTKYQLVPNALEIILEPNNTKAPYTWGGRHVGEALAAAEARLRAAGYRPDLIAPSTSNMTTVMFDEMIAAVPASANLVDEFSYHRYKGDEGSALPAIAQRVRQFGIRSAMLEHIGSGYQNLHKDLTIANVSAWQQFTLAYPGVSSGGAYFFIQNGQVGISSFSKFLRQYFLFVRLGAHRIGATTNAPGLQPVAFVNTDGAHVVVVKANGAQTFSVLGLPPGNYGIFYTTDAAYDVHPPDVTIAGGQPVQASIPAAGVITIHRK